MSPRAQLAFLGACLSRCPEHRVRLAAALAEGLPWPDLLQRAGAQLVTPSLAGALADAGLLERLPEAICSYLQTVRDLNRARNATLLSELVRVAAALNAAGIEPQLLKGAAALLPGQYPGAGDRVIGDLDLRIPGECYAVAAEAVHGLGYQFAEGRAVEPGAHHHGAPLLHPDKPVSVELHQRTLCDRVQNASLEQGMALTALTLPGSDARVRLADPGTRLLHNFLHGQIQDRVHARHGLNLRQLLEFARIADHHQAELDWGALLARLQADHRRAFRLYLAAAEHWLHQPYPRTLGRPIGAAAALWLVELGQSGQGWHQLLGMLPRWRNLPARLVRPSWYAMKVQALRRGDPW